MSTLRQYFETLRHLEPEQVRYQMLYRARRFLPPVRPASHPNPPNLAAAWGPRVQRCWAKADVAVLDGDFSFWGERRRLDLRQPWVWEASRSWSYLVQYFDYAPALAAMAAHGDAGTRQRVLDLFERWIEAHPFGRGIAWHPYPTALRIANWLDALQQLRAVAPEAWTGRVLESVYRQSEWLSHNLERHLLGTHLLKDLKALLCAASVFQDQRAARWRAQCEPLLHRELRAQVHDDGGHIEPSIMYHCTALEDVLDLLNFSGAVVDSDLRRLLERTAERMLSYAQAVATPSGDYPLLGDAWIGGAPAPRDLADYAIRLDLNCSAQSEGLRYFADSGVAVWRRTPHYLVADVGPVGPPHLAAHGHCDSLSFEWYVKGQPLLVDTGTFTYEAGDQRHACRSTSAHNTPQIDAREQHEIWAAFRVARRSDVRARQLNAGCIEAELRPWFAPELCITRTFYFEPSRIRIHDRVTGPGEHHVASRLHVDASAMVHTDGNRLELRNGLARAAIQLPESLDFRLHAPGDAGHQACSFGERVPNCVIGMSRQGALPLEYDIELSAPD